MIFSADYEGASFISVCDEGKEVEEEEDEEDEEGEEEGKEGEEEEESSEEYLSCRACGCPSAQHLQSRNQARSPLFLYHHHTHSCCP